jgi:hypothetical protein
MDKPLLRRASVSGEKVFFSYRTPPARTAVLVVALAWCVAEHEYIAAVVFGAIGVLIAALNPFMVRLTANRDGIRISNWASGGSFAWNEVAKIELVPLRSRGHVIQVTSTEGERVKAFATTTGSRGGQGFSFLGMTEVVERLEALRQAAQPQAKALPQTSVECPSCGYLNHQAARTCEKCHAPMPFSATGRTATT